MPLTLGLPSKENMKENIVSLFFGPENMHLRQFLLNMSIMHHHHLTANMTLTYLTVPDVALPFGLVHYLFY